VIHYSIHHTCFLNYLILFVNYYFQLVFNLINFVTNFSFTESQLIFSFCQFYFSNQVHFTNFLNSLFLALIVIFQLHKFLVDLL